MDSESVLHGTAMWQQLIIILCAVMIGSQYRLFFVVSIVA